MDERVLAYAAGIVDGEGSIFVHWPSGSCQSIALTVATLSYDLAEWLHRHFGGRIGVVNRKGFNKVGEPLRPVHRWRVNGVDAERVIELIRPFLVIKQKQAALALVFRSLGGAGHKVSDEPFKNRATVAAAISELNASGGCGSLVGEG